MIFYNFKKIGKNQSGKQGYYINGFNLPQETVTTTCNTEYWCSCCCTNFIDFKLKRQKSPSS